MRRSRSPTSFCSGSTAFRLSSLRLEVRDLALELLELLRRGPPLGNLEAQRIELLLPDGEIGADRRLVEVVVGRKRCDGEDGEEADLVVPRDLFEVQLHGCLTAWPAGSPARAQG